MPIFFLKSTKSKNDKLLQKTIVYQYYNPSKGDPIGNI